jgi:homoserine dehydrogenase
MPTIVRYTLVGLGNIGRNLLDILAHRQACVLRDYGLRFVLVGAVDSQGAAIDPEGLDPARARDLKLARQSVCQYPLVGRPKMTAVEMLNSVDADMLVEVSPTNLQHGDPGLSCMRCALGMAQHVVTANKGPLVLAFGELMQEARKVRRQLLYSGTVAGGLPTVNLGVRDLAGCEVVRVEGIFNGTTNYILTRMEQEQISYEQALKGAQEAGIAEADPTLDVDGWDAANKLIIIANAVLRRPTSLADVSVQGIRQITLQDLRCARAQGQVLKLLAVAEKRGDNYALSVEPTPLPQDHVLARTGMWDMGVVYTTDYMGVISAVIEEKGPVPTSAAVLRDMINVYSA